MQNPTGQLARKIMKVFLLFIVAGLSWASAAPERQMVYASGPRTSEVPVAHSGFDQLFVMVQIGDRRLKMLLDTGAPTTSIDAAVAESLGLRSDPASRQKITMGGTVVEESVAPAEIKIGEMQIHACPLHLLQFRELREELRKRGREDFDGFVGVDMLVYFKAQIDLERMLLVLNRPGGRK